MGRGLGAKGGFCFLDAHSGPGTQWVFITLALHRRHEASLWPQSDFPRGPCNKLGNAHLSQRHLSGCLVVQELKEMWRGGRAQGHQTLSERISEQ